MNILYSFKTAAGGLSRNKSRSVLTLLGIVIGIASIITIMSIGEGAKNLILGQIQGLGSKTIAIIPGREPNGPSDVAQLLSDSLKEKDLTALKRKENAPTLSEIMPVVFRKSGRTLSEIMPVVFGGETAAYGSETFRLNLFGASELISEIFDLYPEEGNFFGEDEIKSRADVVVIGAKVKDELFGESRALGEKIKIKGKDFRVIGILPKKGQVSFFNFDEMAIAPFTTVQTYILGIKYFHRFIVEADSEANIQRTVNNLEATLRVSHGLEGEEKDDFFIQTQADLAERLGTITSILTILLTSVAGISLLVGGIGIMNIMLVSVTERTREIGLRKAIGATNKNILTQFLLEAVMLTIGGGIVGIILGLSLSFAVSVILGQYLSIDWGFTIPLGAIALGIGLSAFVGIVFGTYPARKASLKSPIEALRYE